MSWMDKWMLFFGVLNLILAFVGIAMKFEWWVITLNLISFVIYIGSVCKMMKR